MFRHFKRTRIPFPALAALLLLLPACLWAHGAGFQEEDGRQVRIVSFQYSSGDPMRYAKTLVFGPQDDKVEFQNGRTDRAGRFAFCPDRPGAWKVIVQDGMGHQVAAEIKVGPAGNHGNSGPKNTSASGPSLAFKAMAGVSLILNLGWAVWGLRRVSRNA